MKLPVLMIALCVTMQSSHPSLAHEGPEHEIDELTERIVREGESADLLLQRAIEYEVIRKYPEAIKDLERASGFGVLSAPVHRELSRAYFATGKTNEALQTVSRAIEAAPGGSERAALLITRAEILQPRKELRKALEDVSQAVEEHPQNVEWYLFRSQLQSRLKLNKERVKGLEQAIQLTGSGVLENELVDALIDSGEHSRALEKVEAELASSRLRSSWLIRRAKIELAVGKQKEARVDCQQAIDELTSRMRSSAPDPSLLADRGVAYEVLGDDEKALKDYNLAREKGLSEDWLQERIHALKNSESAKRSRVGEKKP